MKFLSFAEQIPGREARCDSNYCFAKVCQDRFLDLLGMTREIVGSRIG